MKTPPLGPTLDALEITVWGIAAPAGSKNVGHTRDGRAFVRDSSGQRGKDWRRQVAQTAGARMIGRQMFDGPVELHVTFNVPRPKGHLASRGGLRPSAPVWPTVRPDITKLLRAVEDAMTGIVWRDDSQVVIQRAEKRYCDHAESACVAITVMPAPT